MYISMKIATKKSRHAIEPIIKSATVLVSLVISNDEFLQIVPFLLQDIDMLRLKTSNGRKEKNVFNR
jgi:hypothetical protein